MRNLCKDCSIKIKGEDSSDFSNIITEEQFKEGFKVEAWCCGCEEVIKMDNKGKKVESSQK